MTLAYNQPPVRYPEGMTQDMPWQPLADCGMGNPFFYNLFRDDFHTFSSAYTATKTGNGTIAVTAGDGGLALFTTNSSTPASGDICSMQLPAAAFTLTSGKKLFFQCKLQVSSASNAAFLVGLIQTTTTPFTVTDGIYFSKATGGTALTINSCISSTNTAVTIPTGAYTLADNTNIDLAFYLNRQGDVLAFVDSQLVGFIPQSSANNVGPVARIPAPSLTTANLNPTVAVQSGTASSKTMTVDFISAQKER